ncbi:MAG TPA: ATP-binding protein, partial [Actinomycetota bacterium]|nr:ATP-binding protein [Actinomycetota bacterium]
ALIGVISSNVETEELERIEAQVANAARRLEADETSDRLLEDVGFIADLPNVAERIGAGENPTRLAREILRTVENIRASFVIVDPDNGLPGLAGSGPTVKGKKGGEKTTRLSRLEVLSIMGTGPVRDVQRQGSPRSAAVTRAGDLVMELAVSEVRGPSGERVGSLILGNFIDALKMEELSSTVDAHASLVVGERVIASELPRRHAPQLELPPGLAATLLVDETTSAQQTIGNASYFSGYAALGNRGGSPAGVLILSSPGNVVASTREGVTRTLFIAAMIVGAIALVLAWLSGRRITRPIQMLTQTAGAVREGDLSAQADVSGEDEVGELGETFNEMTASLFRMTNDLRTAAREEHDLRARIETIIESMADGLVAVDGEGNVLAFNREAQHLTGLASEAAVGKPVENVLTVMDANEKLVELPVYALSEGSTGDVFLEHRDGTKIPVAITSAVLLSEDQEITGAVAVIRDITREREVERMKSEFLSNISHELRTPLTPIKGYAELLGRKKVPPEKAQQFISGIIESTGRLERIVALLVDFSALEAGRLSPRSTSVDMAKMLGEVSGRWGERAPRHEIDVRIPAGLPQVVGDERLLERSLDEILDNAVKFSPAGGKVVVEAVEKLSSNGSVPGNLIELRISDQGIGIPPEDLPKVFSDFQQLDGSETRTYGGLGLGLAFVQRIIEAHDGAIKVDSVVDQGTTVTIDLPIVEAVDS